MKLPLIALAASLSFTSLAHAEEHFVPAVETFQMTDAGPYGDLPQFGLNLGVSTLGRTVEPVFRVNDLFGLRAPIGRSSFSGDYEADGNNYSGNLELGGAGLMADFYPLGGNLHFSAGAFKTDYEGSFLATDVENNGQRGSIQVDMTQKEAVSPALAMGYEGRIGQHFTLSATAGALFGKGFDVNGTDTSGTFTDAQVNEEIQEFRDFADQMEVLPYMKLSVGFRF